MQNKELEQEYLKNALIYLKSILKTDIPEEYQAVFIAGVQYGLDIRDQEISK